MAEASNGNKPPQAIIKLSASWDIKCTVLTTNMALSLLLTKSRTDFVEWLLQTCISVSKEKSTSDSNRWWIYDHLNSGILKGGLVGPGLNIGLDEFVLACFDSAKHWLNILFDSCYVSKLLLIRQKHMDTKNFTCSGNIVMAEVVGFYEKFELWNKISPEEMKPYYTQMIEIACINLFLV